MWPDEKVLQRSFGFPCYQAHYELIRNYVGALSEGCAGLHRLAPIIICFPPARCIIWSLSSPTAVFCVSSAAFGLPHECSMLTTWPSLLLWERLLLPPRGRRIFLAIVSFLAEVVSGCRTVVGLCGGCDCVRAAGLCKYQVLCATRPDTPWYVKFETAARMGAAL